MGDFTEKTVRRLFALSGNLCAYPSCQQPLIENTGTVTGEICHIKARNPGGPRFDPGQTEEERHGFDNLILLCRRHHKVVDSQPDVYTVDTLHQIKSIRESMFGRPEREQDGFYAKILINDYLRVLVKNNSGNVAIDSPGVIQGHTVNITTSKKKVTVSPPPGTIGSDPAASRYVQYLIKRYNKFGSADPTRTTRFSYGTISNNIENAFGSQWKLLPLDTAASVFEYLQGRIAKTRLAKINKGKGRRSFRSYEEFLAGDSDEDN